MGRQRIAQNCAEWRQNCARIAHLGAELALLLEEPRLLREELLHVGRHRRALLAHLVAVELGLLQREARLLLLGLRRLAPLLHRDQPGVELGELVVARLEVGGGGVVGLLARDHALLLRVQLLRRRRHRRRQLGALARRLLALLRLRVDAGGCRTVASTARDAAAPMSVHAAFAAAPGRGLRAGEHSASILGHPLGLLRRVMP